MAKIKNSDIFAEDIFVKQAEDARKLLQELTKIESVFADILKKSSDTAKKTPFDSYDNINKFSKAVNDARNASEGLAETQKQSAKIRQQLIQLEDKEVEAKLRFNKANKDQRDEIRDSIILESKEAGTLEKLAASNRKLARERAKLNLDTAKGRKELIAINKQIDLNNEKIKNSSDTVKKQRLNVGNYTESIKGAVRETGLFSREIAILEKIQSTLKNAINSNTDATKAQAAAQTAVNSASLKGVKALKLLKTALASSGVGLIVVALGSLVAFLTKTQSGMDSVERATKAASTTFNVLIDRLAQAGKGISLLFSGEFKEGFAEIKNAFNGIGEEVAEEVALVDDLTKALQNLRKENAKLIVDEARIRAEVAKLRLVAEDESVVLSKRIDSLRKAFDLEKNLASERIRLAREQLLIDITGGDRTKTRADAEKLINDIIEGRADLMIEDLGVANSTVQDLEEANKQIAEIIGAQSEQYEKQRSLLRKINTLTNEQNREQEKSLKTTEAETEATEKKVDQLDKYLQREKELSEKYLADLENTENEGNKRLLELEKQYSNDVLQLQIDRITEELNNEDFAVNEKLKKEKELSDLIIEQEKNRIEEENRLAEEQAEKQRNIAEKEAEQQRQIAETTFAVTEAFIEKSNERRISAIDAQIEATNSQLNTLQENAELQSESTTENIAFERKKQAELAAEREREIKRQKALELGLAVFKTYSAKVGNNEPNALGSTITDTAVLTAFVQSLPTAFTGTNEKTVGEVFGAPHLPNESKDQYIVRVDKDETILSPDKTKEYHNSLKDQSSISVVNNNAEVVNGLKRVENAISSRPEILGIGYSDLTDAIVARERRNNTIYNRHLKTGRNGIFK